VDDTWCRRPNPLTTRNVVIRPAMVGGCTIMEVRGVQKPGATVGGGSPNALLGADTLRGSL